MEILGGTRVFCRYLLQLSRQFLEADLLAPPLPWHLARGSSNLVQGESFRTNFLSVLFVSLLSFITSLVPILQFLISALANVVSRLPVLLRQGTRHSHLPMLPLPQAAVTYSTISAAGI
jgi:hypothetical protein